MISTMQKLILGRVLQNDPRLILAHQPSRGLDIGAVHYVHKKLLEACQKGATILLISEDLDELLSLSDKIMVLYGGKSSSVFENQNIDVARLGLLMAGDGFK